MKALSQDDTLLADTPHARLMREALRSGAMRDTQYERITEAMVALHTLEPTDARSKGPRYAAVKKLVEMGFDLIRRYGEELDEVDQRMLYDTYESILAIRLKRLEGVK